MLFQSISKWLCSGLLFGLAAVAFTQAPQTVTFNPATVVGGNSATGTVSLTSAAPAGGTTVSLSSSSSSVTVPGSVKISAGTTSATFTAQTSTVSATVSSTVKASDGAGAASGILTVEKEGLSSVTFLPNQVVAGSPSTGSIKLLQPAPSGGWKVALSSPSAAVSVPSSITVPSGQTSITFIASTFQGYIGQNVSVAISASDLTSKATGTLTLIYESLQLTLSTNAVVGAATLTGTVTLAYPAPAGGQIVFLYNSDPDVAQIPSLVAVSAGATQATFPIISSNVTGQHYAPVQIEANDGVSFSVASYSIGPSTNVGIVLNPYSVVNQQGSFCYIELSKPAPTGGVTYQLASSSSAAKVPASITIFSGGTTTGFPVTTYIVSVPTSVTITATPTTGTKLSVNLIVRPTYVKWSIPLQANVTGVAAGASGQSYVTSSSSLYAISSTGATLWKTTAASEEPFSSPAVLSNGDICVTSSSVVTCYSPQGKQLWSYNSDLEFEYQPPVASGNNLLVMGMSGTLYELSDTGTLVWKLFQSSETGPVTVGSSGNIYFVDIEFTSGIGISRLNEVSPSGSVVWQTLMYQTAFFVPPVLTPAGGVLVRSEDGALLSFSSTGQLQWINFLDPSPTPSTAVGADGTIYTTNENSLMALTSTGAVKWVYYGYNPVSVTVAKSGSIYFSAPYGFLMGINPSGNILWSSFFGQAGNSVAPVIGSDGTVYAGSLEGKFVAIYP